MFDYKHYVAVLRWQQGEVDAQKLYDQDRKVITPLIELLPDKGGGFPKIIKEIAQNWGFEPFFLDLNRLNPALRLAGGGHPLVLIGNEAKSLPVKLIPVTGLGRDRSYQAAVASVAQANRHGMCVRIYGKDLSRANFPTQLLNLVSHVKLDPEQTDLIVDLEVTEDSNISCIGICRLIPNLGRWRTFTVMSGAFPKDLSKVDKNSQQELQREDWLSWHKQITAKPKLLRQPSYGDYTIQYANHTPPTGKPNPSGSIRYTASDYWVIMRGEALRGDSSPGYAQYQAQALLLRERMEFCGSDFSAGDKYITSMRLGGKNTGNTTTWISAGINHHLTFAARQVASLS
jgi:hypothetical protein